MKASHAGAKCQCKNTAGQKKDDYYSRSLQGRKAKTLRLRRNIFASSYNCPI
jgi:hypothetical protein